MAEVWSHLSIGLWAMAIMSLSRCSVIRFDGLYSCYKPSRYLITIF
jgi:hypothetical protein